MWSLSYSSRRRIQNLIFLKEEAWSEASIWQECKWWSWNKAEATVWRSFYLQNSYWKSDGNGSQGESHLCHAPFTLAKIQSNNLYVMISNLQHYRMQGESHLCQVPFTLAKIQSNNLYVMISNLQCYRMFLAPRWINILCDLVKIIHGLIFYVQEIWHQKRNPSFMYTWHYLTQDRLGKDSLFLSIYFVFCNWYVF